MDDIAIIVEVVEHFAFASALWWNRFFNGIFESC